MKALERFWNFIDQRGIVRRIVLGIAIWMTWSVTTWAMHFAETSARAGMDFAALVAAVTTPVTVFSGYVFKAYIESRAV